MRRSLSCDHRVDGAERGSGAGDHANASATIRGQEMSKVYDETGRELYMGAGDREHD